MQKLWILRTKENFLIFFGGTTIAGLLVNSYWTEQKLKNTVVSKSLQHLESNELVVQILGYPVSQFESYKNRIVVDPTFIHSSFLVRGPRGTIMVDLHAESQLQGRILKENLLGYDIPDQTVLIKLQDLKNNNQLTNADKQIDSDDKFWKITHLHAEIVGEQQRVILIDPSIENDKQNTSVFKTYNELSQEIQKKNKIQNKEDATDLEIEELRKFRQQQFFNKIRNIRLIQGGILFFAGTVGYMYFAKNRRIPLLGSQVHIQVLETLTKNPYFLQKYGQKVNFQKMVRGQIVDKEFKFEQDFTHKYGMSTLYAEGNMDKKENWKIEKLDIIDKQEGRIVKTTNII